MIGIRAARVFGCEVERMTLCRHTEVRDEPVSAKSLEKYVFASQV